MINLNTPNKLPKQFKWYWLTKIFGLILLASLFWHSLFWILIIFIGLPFTLYLFLFYNAFSFIVEDNKITINSGIIIKKSKSIPFTIIQNVDNVQGILHRVFGLSKVNIWTSSPEQITAHKGSTTHKPDGSLDLFVKDSDWLKNFILSKHS
ncbi:MAG TPA: PH domain-containing protein [Patescibacteria group bacterium]|nr:PH domain-containing protein [Patescibacteria group bacterium]